MGTQDMLEEEFMHLAGKKAWMVERMYVEYFISQSTTQGMRHNISE